MTRPLVVVGDSLLDRDVDGRVERLCPDAPAPVLEDAAWGARPGGAALAAALAATAPGAPPVVLVTATGGEAGAELGELLGRAGVEVVELGLSGATPEKIRFRTAGQVLLRLDRGGGLAGADLPPDAARALAGAGAVLVADYGLGVAAGATVRAALAATAAPVVWDPHRRGPDPVPGVALATPNRTEVPGPTATLAEVAASAVAARRRWAAGAVAVTLGARGALLVSGDGAPLAVPAPPVAGPVDACGAGDRFATGAAAALAAGAVASEAVLAGVEAASAFVAAGGAAAWRSPGPGGATPTAPPGVGGRGRGVAEVAARLAAVRDAGGTVVAAGGCFDLLHAGHLAVLRAARHLGDALVVCVNSDASVRRLKGPDRPVVGEADRVAMLGALSCVDEVVTFDEDTPAAVLAALRPDVWVKGGDYAGRELPEAAILAGWGGQAVTVPYLAGRSTTGLLAQVLGAGAG